VLGNILHNNILDTINLKIASNCLTFLFIRHGQSNREKEAVGNEDFGSCLYSGILGNIPSQTTCKQLYREHKLLVITEKGKLEVDNFRLPSACACYLRKEFANFEFRRSPMKRRN